MTDRLSRTFYLLASLALAVVILVYAKPLLVPLALAGVFAMLFVPLSRKLETKGLPRGGAVLLCVLMLVVALAAVIGVIAWQVSEIASDSDEIQKNMNEKLSQLRLFIHDKFGLTGQEQDEIIKKQQSGGSGITGMLAGIVASLGNVLTQLIIVLVYVFLLLYLRGHLKRFVLKIVPAADKRKASVTIEEARGVAQKYLTGMGWMIICLWVMYSIGFSIIGVKHAILFAALCALLEIVPFVGNLTGNLITIIAVIMQGGSTSMIIGVLITYGLVQFLQTYILEPLVVGKGVSINPLFTISGIVAMELVWGIPGMILALPMMGVAKVVFDHIEPLKPYGFLMGGEEKKEKSGEDKGFFGKIKKAFS